KGMDTATNPSSLDYMNFSKGHQPIVDTAFLAHAIVRAPDELFHKLEPEVKNNVVQALKATRSRKPFFSNWLLFSAMIETALFLVGEEDWDPMRIDFALKQHEQWYVGDGMYSDGVELDRKSTRLNSSHVKISYAVFCLKKKNHINISVLRS